MMFILRFAVMFAIYHLAKGFSDTFWCGVVASTIVDIFMLMTRTVPSVEEKK
jgi:hypothetical protein